MKNAIKLILLLAAFAVAASLQAQESGVFACEFDKFRIKHEGGPKHINGGAIMIDISKSKKTAYWGFASGNKEPFKFLYQDKDLLNGTWIILCRNAQSGDIMTLHYRSSGSFIGGEIVRKRKAPDGTYRVYRTEFNRKV